jgi:hypothetical protein
MDEFFNGGVDPQTSAPTRPASVLPPKKDKHRLTNLTEAQKLVRTVYVKITKIFVLIGFGQFPTFLVLFVQ